MKIHSRTKNLVVNDLYNYSCISFLSSSEKTIYLLDIDSTKEKVEKQAPERPKQSIPASKYLRLQDVCEQLLKQSRAIQNKKIDIEELEEKNQS